MDCDDIDPYDVYDEYMDHDAIACANGDYNTWEENQVWLDHEADDLYWNDDPYAEEPDLGVSDDNWACGTLDVET